MSADMPLHILSGGAAEALIDALAPQFKAASGHDVAGEFGAVGIMRDKLVAGAPADLAILTAALIASLERDGHVVAGASRPLGVVRTGVAVRAGDPAPPIG